MTIYGKFAVIRVLKKLPSQESSLCSLCLCLLCTLFYPWLFGNPSWTLRVGFVRRICSGRLPPLGVRGLVVYASESHCKDTVKWLYRQGFWECQLHNTAQLEFCTRKILIFKEKWLYLHVQTWNIFLFLEPVARGD